MILGDKFGWANVQDLRERLEHWAMRTFEKLERLWLIRSGRMYEYVAFSLTDFGKRVARTLAP